jgi:aspartate/methionine/tyrosine aminotransferase
VEKILFSQRVDWDLTPNLLAERVVAKKQAGKAFYDLTGSNPTTIGLVYDRTEICSALNSSEATTYAPESLGLTKARQAISEYYLERSAPVDADHICITAGTSEAYGILFKLLANPGDEVLIPMPGYPLLSYLSVLESLKPVSYPLHYDDHKGWFIDMDVLEALITPQTRAILAVSPGNPVGAYLKESELDQLSEISEQKGIALVVDEVFFDFPSPQGQNLMRSAACRSKGLIFVLNGFSKILGLPQMKLSWIGVAGKDQWKSEAIKRLEFINDFYLSAATGVQLAARRLLALGPSIRRQLIDRIQSNTLFLEEMLSSTLYARMLIREGGWYAVLEIFDRMTDEDRVLNLLEKHDTLVHPGYFYGFHREGYMVVSLLTVPEIFQTGMRRLISAGAQG